MSRVQSLIVQPRKLLRAIEFKSCLVSLPDFLGLSKGHVVVPRCFRSSLDRVDFIQFKSRAFMKTMYLWMLQAALLVSPETKSNRELHRATSDKV